MVSRLEKTLFNSASLRTISCAVIGTGALGSEIARLLGQLGVGHIQLIDPDTIAEVNLPHSIFFRGSARVGDAKVAAIATLAGQLFPDTCWMPVQQEIAKVPLSALAACDLFFVCPDTVIARVEAAYVARRLAKPCIDAALLGESWWRGRVTSFPAALAASCYLCQFTEQARSILLTRVASVVPGCSSRPPSPELASTPVMASAAAALAVDTGLRALLLADPNQASTLPCDQNSFALDLSLEGADSRLARHGVTRSSTCPWHETTMRASIRRFEHEQQSIAELLGASHLETLMLEWPLILRARCLACGAEYAPLAQVASFGANACCPVCQSAHQLPVKIISEIHRDSPEARQSPARFGLIAPFLASAW